MKVKCLEIRDVYTFIPVICLKPTPENEAQRYLLRRDGYSCQPSDDIVIMIKAQCDGVSYDPYKWPSGARTMQVAHNFIRDCWDELNDGDVVDVQYILGETNFKKKSERLDTGVI
jgi:hypothetical protein